MTTKPNHSLYLRVVSALVLMPLVLWCITYGGWPFLFMTGMAIGLSLKEWTRMALASPTKARDLLIGIPYIAACFAAFVYLRLYHPNDGALTVSNNGVALTLCLLLCVWATDIGAYFTGKTIGGPKMAPSISPNKTWSGLIGGVLSSVAIFFAYKYALGPYLGDLIGSDFNLPQGFTAMHIAVFGILIAISDQIGDLLISKQKRKVGFKDTGTLIPGHGGLLDRIDGLLLAAPVFVIGLKVFGL